MCGFEIGIELIIRLLGLSDTGNFRPVLGTTTFLGQFKTQRCRSVVQLRSRLEFEEGTIESCHTVCPFQIKNEK